MQRLTLALALSLGVMFILEGDAFAQVDEPPPPPPLGDVDEPPPPPPPARGGGGRRRGGGKKKAPAATDGDSPVVKANGEEGNMGLFFRFGGMGTMATGGDHVAANSSALNTQIGFKFVMSESFMLPIFFGTGIYVSKVDEQDGANNFSMDLGVGVEYHFRIWRRISPFLGGLLKLGFYDPTNEDNLVFRFNIGPQVGVEYYIADRVSLTAAYLLMFSVTRTTTGSDSGKTDFNMSTQAGYGLAASSGGDLTLTFYF